MIGQILPLLQVLLRQFFLPILGPCLSQAADQLDGRIAVVILVAKAEFAQSYIHQPKIVFLSFLSVTIFLFENHHFSCRFKVVGSQGVKVDPAGG